MSKVARRAHRATSKHRPPFCPRLAPFELRNQSDEFATFALENGIALGKLPELVRRFCGWLPLLAVLVTTQGCGGPDTKLIIVHAPGVHRGVSLVVRNRSDSVIGGFFLAKTSVVRSTHGHSELGSEAEAETWGNDLLGASLLVGAEQPVPVADAGLWDARPVDEEGRYQHIAGLKLQRGRQYVLELHDGGWRYFH